MSLVKRLYCPACGAPLKAERGEMVSCDYCGSTLLVEEKRVSESPTSQEKRGPTAPPPSALITEDVGRFEVSLLEQFATETVQDGFSTLPLPEGRFALIFLRLTDAKSQTLESDYLSHGQFLKQALSEHEDPGLAAFELLELLSEQRAEFLLEITIVLFDPKFCTATAYNAGGQRSVYWVSGEEGRVIDVFRSYPPLERKMLRMSRDHFSNSEPVFLCGSDLVVGVSAAFSGRGGGPYSDGTGALVRSLEKNLGEHPLKVVTLAKNAFWEERPAAASEHPLSGTLRVAAVRAKGSEIQETIELAAPSLWQGPEFEISYYRGEKDLAEIIDLHDQRQVFLWLQGDDFTPQDYQLAREAVLALLDRPDYGDNENPRRAGREAMEAVGRRGRLLVLLLLNKYGRCKWYRHAWGQPIGLGARGLSDPPSSQMFDEGGEGTVPTGTRLFFPGSLRFSKSPQSAMELAQSWHGGKASALYSKLFSHWRIHKSALCLNRFLQAARADDPGAALDGCCLVGRVGKI